MRTSKVWYIVGWMKTGQEAWRDDFELSVKYIVN